MPQPRAILGLMRLNFLAGSTDICVERSAMSKAKEIEQQLARQFVATDWLLFKRMADANLSEAAHLKKKDMRGASVSPLLARNVRKRLLIGLGTELLLKALFLKRGYAVNLPKGKAVAPFPTRFQDIGDVPLQSRTATLDQCLTHLDVVLSLEEEHATEGLRIAKVFRNKEAHSVIYKHPFDAETYRMIERSLVSVYRQGFSEELAVTIAMTKDDKAVWKIKQIHQT